MNFQKCEWYSSDVFESVSNVLQNLPLHFSLFCSLKIALEKSRDKVRKVSKEIRKLIGGK